MTIYSQPNAKVFAEDAPSSEIADFKAWARGLGIAFDETNGYPQMEGFNGLLNALSQYIKYLEQRGIPMWRADLEYPVDARVIYNSLEYRCISQNTNAQPDLSQTSWSLVIVDNLTSTSTQSSLSANQGRVLLSMLNGGNNQQWIGSTLIQWGTVTGLSFGKQNVKYNRSFPNNAFCVISSNSSSGNDSSNIVKSYLNRSDLLSSFTCDIKNYGGVELTDVSWIAIGN